ncbi:MAG: hypothetical protein AAB824_00860 [Patescibacteria group bacterium]
MINIISLALVWSIFGAQNASIWTFSGANNDAEARSSQSQLLAIQEVLSAGKNTEISDKVISSLTITGYSSTPEQTDSDPFITASGRWVRSGIIAANFLPFGTKIKIPEIFGDRVFTVEDRMARKHPDKVDIWFSSEAEALRFGIKTADIVILD